MTLSSTPPLLLEPHPSCSGIEIPLAGETSGFRTIDSYLDREVNNSSSSQYRVARPPPAHTYPSAPIWLNGVTMITAFVLTRLNRHAQVEIGRQPCPLVRHASFLVQLLEIPGAVGYLRNGNRSLLP